MTAKRADIAPPTCFVSNTPVYGWSFFFAFPFLFRVCCLPQTKHDPAVWFAGVRATSQPVHAANSIKGTVDHFRFHVKLKHGTFFIRYPI